MTDRVDRWVQRIEHAAVVAANSSLRRDGLVPPVTVHVLSSRRDPPYVAWLLCRPCRPGLDAAVAVASMGILPAVLGADRIVVCWERVQLAAELQVPGALALPPGLVVLDADRTAHEVRSHPPNLGTVTAQQEAAVVIPRWGPMSRRLGGPLPEPVGRLLALWRAERKWSRTQAVDAVQSLEAAGYGLRWVRSEAPADADVGEPGLPSGQRAERVRRR